MQRPLFTLIGTALLLIALYAGWPDSEAPLLDDKIEATQAPARTITTTSPSIAPAPEVSAAAASPPPDETRQPQHLPTDERLLGVSGWIGNRAGTGLADVEIEIQSQGFDGADIVAFKTRSNQLGEFRFDNLVAGHQYRLEVLPHRDYAAFSIDAFSAEQAQALRRIVLDRVNLVDADGMIVDTNRAPVGDFELSVRSLAAEFPDRLIKSDASGYFRLDAFPAGELRIATNASDYYSIKGLQLRPDAYQNLTLIIDRGSYHLSGIVSDANGAPVQQAQVTLKSAFATADYHSYSYRSTVTDSGGGFEFAELGGNRLTLGVYARGFRTHIQQHNFASFSDRVEISLRRHEGDS